MKNLPILYFTFLLFLFFSCEFPKEKTTSEEEVVKVKTSVDSTESIIKEPVSTEYVYKLYGCLNKDNLIPDGENRFILKHKNKYFNLIWKCEKGDCWLEDKYGFCNSRVLNDIDEGPSIPPKTSTNYEIVNLRFSCYDLIDQESIYNSTNDIRYR